MPSWWHRVAIHTQDERRPEVKMYQMIPSASLPVFHGASSSRVLTPSLDALNWDRKQTVKRATRRPAGNGTAKQARPPRGGQR